MRALTAVSMLVFVTFFVGCEGKVQNYESQIKDKDSRIKSLESDKAESARTVAELRKKTDDLSKEATELRKSKERGAVEISNLKWTEKEAEFQIFLTGTVKNTGRAYLRDVTLKVSLFDETHNPLVVSLVNDPCERVSETMHLYHHVADSLGEGDSKDFQMIIYTHLMHGDGKAKVRKAIGDPKLQEIIALFVSG
jgi:hypothetical protein